MNVGTLDFAAAEAVVGAATGACVRGATGATVGAAAGAMVGGALVAPPVGPRDGWQEANKDADSAHPAPAAMTMNRRRLRWLSRNMDLIPVPFQYTIVHAVLPALDPRGLLKRRSIDVAT
jgi:hypothetical protein